MSDDEGEEGEAGAAEAGEATAQSVAPSADVAAVEGLLSDLALSDAGIESVMADAPEARAAGHPDQATATAAAPPASRDAAAPGSDAADGDAPAPAAAEHSVGAAQAEPDPAAPAPAGNDPEGLVEEAEQQLAQLHLGAGRSAEAAEAPYSEEQQAAEVPQVAGSAAGTTVSNGKGARNAGQEILGRNKPPSSKRGSLTKKVLNPPSYQ